MPWVFFLDVFPQPIVATKLENMFANMTLQFFIVWIDLAFASMAFNVSQTSTSHYRSTCAKPWP